VFDREEKLDADTLEPMITYGTNPGMGIPIGSAVRSRQRDGREGAGVHGPRGEAAAAGAQGRRRVHRQLHELAPVGSAAAAGVLKGRKVADGVRVLVVPGSQQIKAAAEAEGLDRVFREAGAEWREAGCSMCIAMNGDQLSPGQYAVSTSNRNFEGGRGGRPDIPREPAHRGGRGGHGPDHRCTGARVMEKVTTITSRTVLLPVENVDTDQIIPARFLKATSKAGLGSKLFADWRFSSDGKQKPDFVLNQPAAAGRRCWSRATTSAADRRASTRPGRSTTTASARSSARRSRTSSATTRSRTGWCRSSSTPPRTPSCWRRRGAEVTVSVADQTLTLPDGSKAKFPMDSVCALLPAQRRRRAGVPAVAGRPRSRPSRRGAKPIADALTFPKCGGVPDPLNH
jgi:hypothetical protein